MRCKRSVILKKVSEWNQWLASIGPLLLFLIIYCMMPIHTLRAEEKAAPRAQNPEENPEEPSEQPNQTKTDDSELEKARKRALATLDRFWQAFENPGEGEESFMIKVRIQDANATEYFWCGRIQRSETGIKCTVANEPREVQSVAFGEIIAVDQDQIVDWMYRKNGFIHGNYSMRVLIERMPAEKAEFYRSMLAPETE